MRLAAYCSAKGRVMGSFFIWRYADAFYLLCQAELIGKLIQRFNLFKLRSKCVFSDLSTEYLYQTVLTPRQEKLVAETSESHHLLILPCLESNAHSAGLRMTPLTPKNTNQPQINQLLLAPPYYFEYALQQLGIAYITQTTYEQFTVQNMNYDLIGGVDFNKGCYPGQEIVARSHYLGKIKKRALLATTNQEVKPGQDLWLHADNPHEPVGVVINACRFEGKTYLLVEAPLQEAIEEKKQFCFNQTNSDDTFYLSAPPYDVLAKGNQLA